MNTNDILEDIISGLQPEDVPAQYIIMAKVIDQYGVERVIRGAELEAFLSDPDRSFVAEARVILDVKKIRSAILAAAKAFFDDLHARINGMDGEKDAD